MRKIKEVLRLKFEVGLGLRQIARSCSIGLGTVHEYLQRAEAAGVTWPLGQDWDDDRLEAACSAVRHGPPGGVADAGLRRSSPAAAATSTPDPAVALGGVPAGQPGRLPLLAVSASCTSAGGASRTWCCGRSTRPARSCSSIGREQRSRSMIRVAVRCSRRICSSPCWEPVPTPTPKPPPTSSWQAGSALTCAPSSSIRACRNWSCPTTPRPA